MADKGNAQGLGGTNKQTPIGQAQKSGNDFLGINDRVAKGTTGSRPDISSRYGGDKNTGTFFKGDSAAPTSRESNSGGNEGVSSASNQYGKGDFTKGTVGSREQMPKYGGKENVGTLVGDGAGSTKPTNPNDQYKRDLPTQPGQDVVAGTDSAKTRNMPQALKGIGKAGKRGARM